VGLLTGLVTLPLAPVRGVGWIAEQLAEQAEAELYDEQRILGELSALERAHEAGDVTDDQLEEGTDALLARLTEARHFHEQRGLHG
jgi:hypothetical protein